MNRFRKILMNSRKRLYGRKKDRDRNGKDRRGKGKRK